MPVEAPLYHVSAAEDSAHEYCNSAAIICMVRCSKLHSSGPATALHSRSAVTERRRNSGPLATATRSANPPALRPSNKSEQAGVASAAPQAAAMLCSGSGQTPQLAWKGARQPPQGSQSRHGSLTSRPGVLRAATGFSEPLGLSEPPWAPHSRHGALREPARPGRPACRCRRTR